MAIAEQFLDEYNFIWSTAHAEWCGCSDYNGEKCQKIELETFFCYLRNYTELTGNEVIENAFIDFVDEMEEDEEFSCHPLKTWCQRWISDWERPMCDKSEF